MENQVNSKNIIINYGLLLGFISILLALVVYAAGNHYQPHWSVSVVSTLITIGFIIYGIKKFKILNNGFISWGQAVKIGVGISIISALIYAIYQYIFVSFIEPDFMEQVLKIQNEKMIEQGYSEEQIEAANEMSKKFSSPLFTGAFTIIISAILSFIISAIVGAIMKKNEEETF